MSIIPSNIATKATGVKMFDLIVDITGWLDGSFSDWPANIQDVILEALEKKSQEVQLPLAIIFSKCDIDYSGGPNGQDRFYLHVVASEIVAADSRYFKDSQAKMREMINQLTNSTSKK